MVVAGRAYSAYVDGEVGNDWDPGYCRRLPQLIPDFRGLRGGAFHRNLDLKKRFGVGQRGA